MCEDGIVWLTQSRILVSANSGQRIIGTTALSQENKESRSCLKKKKRMYDTQAPSLITSENRRRPLSRAVVGRIPRCGEGGRSVAEDDFWIGLYRNLLPPQIGVPFDPDLQGPKACRLVKV